MHYRFSKYTKRLVVNSRIFLYNTYTEALILLRPEIDELIQSNVNSIDKIEEIHPELFQELKNRGYIVEEGVIDYILVQKEWEKESNDSTKFTLILNPTLSCNMRCWYCYETHLPSTKMPLHIVESVKKLISLKVRESKLIGFNLDFFGGEPLLAYNYCVRDLISYANNECISQGKKMYLSFTTNGYLLTEDILSDFDIWADFANVKLQITLDGNSFCHNNTRKLGGKFPTYNKILSNVISALKHKTNILLRLNYTDDNIFSFYDVIDDLNSKCNFDERKKLTISFHRVWQNADSEQLKESVINVMNAFEKSGYDVENTFVSSKARCYGDMNNTVVINYDGDVYKCTARDFDNNNCEGFLNSSGEIIWNNHYKKRVEASSKFEICHNCVIYPICHAGCSQNRLETLDSTVCVKGYTPIIKEQIIRDIVEDRIKRLM